MNEKENKSSLCNQVVSIDYKLFLSPKTLKMFQNVQLHFSASSFAKKSAVLSDMTILKATIVKFVQLYKTSSKSSFSCVTSFTMFVEREREGGGFGRSTVPDSYWMQ